MAESLRSDPSPPLGERVALRAEALHLATRRVLSRLGGATLRAWFRLRAFVGWRGQGARRELASRMTRERGLVQLDAQTGALGDGDVAVADLEAGARDLTPASLEVHEVLGDEEVRDGRRDLEGGRAPRGGPVAVGGRDGNERR